MTIMTIMKDLSPYWLWFSFLYGCRVRPCWTTRSIRWEATTTSTTNTSAGLWDRNTKNFLAHDYESDDVVLVSVNYQKFNVLELLFWHFYVTSLKPTSFSICLAIPSTSLFHHMPHLNDCSTSCCFSAWKSFRPRRRRGAGSRRWPRLGGVQAWSTTKTGR